jgi:hypothetical protein
LRGASLPHRLDITPPKANVGLVLLMAKPLIFALFTVWYQEKSEKSENI